MFGSGPGGSVLSYSQLQFSPDSLFVDRDRFEKNYVDRAGRRRRGERTKAEDKVMSPMCWAGLDILIEK